MESLRIQRLRSLSDTGNIDIKPITVLLGQNSAGKSTFLRVLPLLKQSVESRTTGPILWYGRLVDFGNFEDAHQHGSENTIAFSFKFKIKTNRNSYLLYLEEYPYVSRVDRFRVLHDLDIDLTLEITEDKKKEVTKASKLILVVEDSKIEINFGNNESVSKFYVNSLDVLKFETKYIAKKLAGRFLLPSIHEVEQKKESDLDNTDIPYFKKRSNARFGNFKSILGIFIKQIRNKVHHATSDDTILGMSLGYGIGSSETILKDFKERGVRSWKKCVENWSTDTQEFKFLRDLLIARSVPVILGKCDEILADFSKSVSYMGPVRATAERYYRTQDLAVDEIDYQGRNLTIFLRNLTDSEMRSFSEWTQVNFGFAPSLQSSFGHISLKIQPKGSSRNLNIADTGFGFSQILPIITQLWLLSVAPKQFSRLTRYRSDDIPVTYAIEQPELHLHPRLQGVLTDTFITSINTAKDNNIDLRLLIETHSEAMVNRLGHLVAEGSISPDLINIVLFEPTDNPGEISVRNSKFDDQGYLTNWPLGFFEMDFL